MKKRTLAMLLALVLVISIVPVAAMAATAECNHNVWDGKDIVPAGNGKHNILCGCGNVVNTQYCTNDGSDKCEYCDQSLKKAGATEPKCEHARTDIQGYNHNDTGGHRWTCKCGEKASEDCTFQEGKCIYCGYADPTYVKPTEPKETEPKETEPKCKHVATDCKWTPDLFQDNRHIWDCKCGASGYEPCEYQNGQCILCKRHDPNYVEPTEPEETKPETKDCTCTILDASMTGELKSNGNGTHTLHCEHGKSMNHTTDCVDANKDGKCDDCNGEMKAESKPDQVPATPVCKHTYETLSYKGNSDGTHTVSCTCGYKAVKGCVYEDDVCIFCHDSKNKDCACTVLDASKNGELKSNGNGTHSLFCEHGKSVNHTTDCVDANKDGKCDDCNGEMKAESKPDQVPATPVCKHTYETLSYKTNSDGTHTVSCTCGYKTVRDCIYDNGVCIFCHYNKNTVKCDCGLADGVKATYVGGGKHEITCEHGKVVNTTWCTKGDDGKCNGCGHEMDEETTTPSTPDDTKPSAPTQGLDSVPKTGDNGSIIVMGFVAVLAMFGGAYLFTKKRAF